ncbi:hypothetical protein BDY17DRAFT_249818 [Neohortaea acidophila]|uniref:Autophagy-related protein 2 n=1 Tax=Neohortaea acidophila TaxID=245834 RepID=A0A6A6PUZ9_9PEZI|nr:uncharacterized protein BDY17DRAFT_249818 [Neohortaea acidophila]KAF2483273.1 hypothetical protein BDY17DRAFT_249818 [Neohortaea acidophila]
MAWWQKKILRYALLRTGLLDEKALDLDHLDITLGKQNVIELKDVALNITRLGKIAQLPPGLRIETARILSLRLTVPADIYHSSISAEVDGVAIGLTLDEKAEVNTTERRSRPSSPLTTRSPQHRKTHRRLSSPPPYDPGGPPDSEDAHLPTTEELAKSFLREEPAHGRRQLEASVVASDKGLDESIVSESSDGDEVGVGAAMGLPGFLASFLQGIVDRLRIAVLNVEVKLETEVPGDGKPAVPLTLCLNIGKFELVSADVAKADAPLPDSHSTERQIKLADISLCLLSDAAIFSELSELRSFSSPTASSQRDRSPVLARSRLADLSLSPSQRSYATAEGRSEDATVAQAQKPILASTSTVDADLESDSGDDLATSQFFTHEQAESMYMSAMSQSTRMHVPGGWSADDLKDSSRAAHTQSPPTHLPALAESMERKLDTEATDLDQRYHTPGNSTPRVPSPVDRSILDQIPTPITHKASRQLLHVDSLHVWIPTASSRSEDDDSSTVQQSATSKNASNGKMPGSFSMYSEMSASRRNPANFSRQDSSGTLSPAQQNARPSDLSQPIKLEVGSVRCQLDVPCGRLLYRLGSKTSTILPATKPSDSHAFSMYLGSSRCLSFSRSPDMMASVILTGHTPDIAVSLRNQQTPPRQPTKDISIQTLALVVMLDIPALEETFQPFGGLSGMLEAGNSILLESGIVSPASSPIKSPKGVRFEGDLKSLEVASELKVNAIFGGVDGRLQGASCAVDLRSTAVKALYRAQGAVVTIAHVEVAVPQISGDGTDAAISVELFASRLEYLPAPQDKDLERLLSLITPSKDKYDTDDDILIDTLLRQRKKGAVARASISEVKTYVEDWSSVQALSNLAEELSKFSAVTKYLPEDERPGLLTLIRVKDFNGRVPVNKRFGELIYRLTDIHCAQISLPALFAVSVGDVNASQAEYGKLVHSLIQSAGLDNLPLFMARMLGDEIEATLKIKLYNVCVEYSVPVVVALTDLSEGMSQDEVVMELAQSVVNLMPHPNQRTTRDSSPMRDAPTSSSKKMIVDLLIHDSAIGLSPQRLPSKALLVLTDARISVTYPPEPVLAAQLELRKAGLFIADQTLPDDADIAGPVRSSPSNTATKAKLTLLLSKRGYVSVGSIMAAKVDVRVEQSEKHGTTTIDVGLTNELLLLETCADSTQTMIATLSGLLPPTPPAKQPMYQTQPMTIEEMMASFTGDAFEKPAKPAETLFDIDEEPDDNALLSFGMGKLAEDDDLLSESEMTSSLYGPVSGVLGAMGDSEQEDDSDHFPATLKVRDLHIIWNIYDGYDWQRTREGITEAVEQVELRAEERKARRRQSAHDAEDDESVIADFLFNSIYIGVPSRHDAHDLRRQINRDIDELVSETESVPVSGMSRPATVYSASGRPVRSRQKKRLKLERSRTHKIAFELKGVSADILVFPEDSAEVVSSVDVRVRDVEVFDNVPTSTWRKFLTHLSNEPGDREMAKPMLHLELFNVRTLEKFAASEIVLHVSLLPLRLHVDQDALDFITRFFEFKDAASTAPASPSEQPFIQRLEVDTVDLRLDYKPKKVDYVGLRSGHTTEFMNFVILDAADIRLKHAIIYGIKGFDPIHKTLNDIWMPDVKRNQLPTVLGGLAPVRSLVNIGSGVRDIVAIPIREYRKDGRIVRSVQKGAFQFGKTTAAELARLGAKVAMGTQTILQGAEGYLSPASDSPGRPGSMTGRSPDQAWHDMDAEDEEHESRAISAYANQPIGLIPGLRSAQRYLEYDLLTARDALIAVQGEVLESEGPSSAATAVARHAPTIILRPFIGATRAIGTTLLGVGNQIDRENMRRVEDVSLPHNHWKAFADLFVEIQATIDGGGGVPRGVK